MAAACAFTSKSFQTMCWETDVSLHLAAFCCKVQGSASPSVERWKPPVSALHFNLSEAVQLAKSKRVDVLCPDNSVNAIIGLFVFSNGKGVRPDRTWICLQGE